MRFFLSVFFGLALFVLAGPPVAAQVGDTDLLEKIQQMEPAELKAALDRAHEGDSDAQVMVALAYQHGIHVPQDPAEALRWYRTAAEKANPSAQHLLGRMYLSGEGVEQDPAQARDWFRKAADQGYAAAQCDYAMLFLDGVGVPQNNAEAFKWFSLAAEGGSLTGLTYVGVMYLNGLGVSADINKGLGYLRQAAESGSPMAQANLGVMYANGVGVGQDTKEALIWLYMAEKGGMAEVTPIISDMTGPMSDAEIGQLKAQAEQRYEECAARNAPTSDTEGTPAVAEMDSDSARAEIAAIGEWLAVKLEEWGTFAVDVRRDMARARVQDEVPITLRGRVQISDVTVEQCVLHYTVIESLDPSAPPVRWEADLHLGVIGLSELKTQQYTVPEGWRTVGGTRSEVYLWARNYPDLYFIYIDPERTKRMARVVLIPILKHDFAEEVEAKLRRGAELCGAT